MYAVIVTKLPPQVRQQETDFHRALFYDKSIAQGRVDSILSRGGRAELTGTLTETRMVTPNKKPARIPAVEQYKERLESRAIIFS